MKHGRTLARARADLHQLSWPSQGFFASSRSFPSPAASAFSSCSFPGRRLVHGDSSKDDRTATVALGPGIPPLEVLGPSELLNEVTRLEALQYATISPQRYCTLLVSSRRQPRLAPRVWGLASKVVDTSMINAARVTTYGMVFRVLAHLRGIPTTQLDTMVGSTLATMTKTGVKLDSSTLASMLTLFVRGKQTPKALTLFNFLMEKKRGSLALPLDAKPYTALLFGLAQRASLKQAMHYMELMRADGAVPNGLTYTALIHAARRDLPCALKLWDEMVNEAGIPPHVGPFNRLLNACLKRLDLDTALQLLNQTKKGKGTSGKTPIPIEPNEVTYSTIIRLCGKLGKFDTAQSLFEEMRSRGVRPTAYSFNALILSYGERGDVKQCFELLAQMDREQVRPSPFTGLALIRACLEADDFRMAVETIARMKRQYGIVPRQTLLEHLIKTAKHIPSTRPSDLVRFVSRVEQTEGTLVKLSTYCHLIELCGERGELELAFMLHDKLFPSARRFPLQRLLDESLILACAKASNTDKALDVIESIIQRKHAADGEETENRSESKLISRKACQCLLKSIDLNKAETLLFHMEALGWRPTVDVIQTLTSRLEANQMDLVFPMLRNLQQRGMELDHSVIYTSFIDSFLRKGNVGRAFAVVEQLVEQGISIRPSTIHLFLRPQLNVNERIRLIPRLVKIMYWFSPKADPKHLLLFVHFQISFLKERPNYLAMLVRVAEEKYGHGEALAKRLDRKDIVYCLMPLLRAYIILGNTQRATDLILAVRKLQHTISVKAYHLLLKTAIQRKNAGAAEALRAIMTREHIPIPEHYDTAAKKAQDSPPSTEPLPMQASSIEPKEKEPKGTRDHVPETQSGCDEAQQKVVGENPKAEPQQQTSPQQTEGERTKEPKSGHSNLLSLSFSLLQKAKNR